MSSMRERTANEKFCSSCGQIISKEAEICPKCGARQEPYPGSSVSADWLIVLLLCLFLGGVGAHRFYVGKIGTAILMILTLGGFGIWSLIDLILIIMGKFTDAQGNPIVQK